MLGLLASLIALNGDVAMAIIELMNIITAETFKDVCLQALAEVVNSRRPIVITRHGEAIAKLVPVTPPARARTLIGSVVAESGDPCSTGDMWVGV
jgi:antitoxin (DNA-binding transcriptional repressor) of toxin-antitoxin stability system